VQWLDVGYIVFDYELYVVGISLEVVGITDDGCIIGSPALHCCTPCYLFWDALLAFSDVWFHCYLY
jgi:hypothetical protein